MISQVAHSMKATANLSAQQEICLVLSIGGKLFKALPVTSVTEGEEGEYVMIVPIKEKVTPANTADVDKFLDSEEVPECWRHFDRIAYDVAVDAFSNSAGVSWLCFRDEKWERTGKSHLVFAPSVVAFLARFKTE